MNNQEALDFIDKEDFDFESEEYNNLSEVDQETILLAFEKIENGKDEAEEDPIDENEGFKEDAPVELDKHDNKRIKQKARATRRKLIKDGYEVPSIENFIRDWIESGEVIVQKDSESITIKAEDFTSKRAPKTPKVKKSETNTSNQQGIDMNRESMKTSKRYIDYATYYKDGSEVNCWYDCQDKNYGVSDNVLDGQTFNAIELPEMAKALSKLGYQTSADYNKSN